MRPEAGAVFVARLDQVPVTLAARCKREVASGALVIRTKKPPLFTARAGAESLSFFRSQFKVDGSIQSGNALNVKFVRIKFASREDEAKAFHGLIQRARVISLRDDEFIVPAEALDWLRSQNLTPTVLASLNQDDVLQTVRDSLAHTV